MKVHFSPSGSSTTYTQEFHHWAFDSQGMLLLHDEYNRVIGRFPVSTSFVLEYDGPPPVRPVAPVMEDHVITETIPKQEPKAEPVKVHDITNPSEITRVLPPVADGAEVKVTTKQRSPRPRPAAPRPSRAKVPPKVSDAITQALATADPANVLGMTSWWARGFTGGLRAVSVSQPPPFNTISVPVHGAGVSAAMRNSGIAGKALTVRVCALGSSPMRTN